NAHFFRAVQLLPRGGLGGAPTSPARPPEASPAKLGVIGPFIHLRHVVLVVASFSWPHFDIVRMYFLARACRSVPRPPETKSIQPEASCLPPHQPPSGRLPSRPFSTLRRVTRRSSRSPSNAGRAFRNCFMPSSRSLSTGR